MSSFLCSLQSASRWLVACGVKLARTWPLYYEFASAACLRHSSTNADPAITKKLELCSSTTNAASCDRLRRFSSFATSSTSDSLGRRPSVANAASSRFRGVSNVAYYPVAASHYSVVALVVRAPSILASRVSKRGSQVPALRAPLLCRVPPLTRHEGPPLLGEARLPISPDRPGGGTTFDDRIMNAITLVTSNIYDCQLIHEINDFLTALSVPGGLS